MLWETLWALVLGFSLSAFAQASFQWNYTIWLDFAAILLAGWFVWIHFRRRRADKKD